MFIFNVTGSEKNAENIYKVASKLHLAFCNISLMIQLCESGWMCCIINNMGEFKGPSM